MVGKIITKTTCLHEVWDQKYSPNNMSPYNIKARIDKKQQNSRCRLCSDRDEMINHMISECSKLAQKEYKIRHDWVGKRIVQEI